MNLSNIFSSTILANRVIFCLFFTYLVNPFVLGNEEMNSWDTMARWEIYQLGTWLSKFYHTAISWARGLMAERDSFLLLNHSRRRVFCECVYGDHIYIAGFLIFPSMCNTMRLIVRVYGRRNEWLVVLSAVLLDGWCSKIYTTFVCLVYYTCKQGATNFPSPYSDIKKGTFFKKSL